MDGQPSILDGIDPLSFADIDLDQVEQIAHTDAECGSVSTFASSPMDSFGDGANADPNAVCQGRADSSWVVVASVSVNTAHHSAETYTDIRQQLESCDEALSRYQAPSYDNYDGRPVIRGKGFKDLRRPQLGPQGWTSSTMKTPL